MRNLFRYLFCSLILTSPISAAINNQKSNALSIIMYAQSQILAEPTITNLLLVNFGNNRQTSILHANWNDVIRDVYTNHIEANGISGTATVIGTNGGYNFQGIIGNAMEFQAGYLIQMNWF